MADARPVPIVIGTAGHIDHGKSSLIIALTGTNPDRFPEEQARGITLDLGYAQMSYPDGLEIGFVDVPGHERLVRNMVAGATGMGAAMLVIACDDAVMLQTREHFEVLRLLGVDQGLIVLSKADVADEEMRQIARADVEDLVRGTPWESAPVLFVSAHKGEGMAELKDALRTLALQARRAADGRHAFFLPLQRSFAVQGAGTVATGVTATGTVKTGDELELLPAGKRSRVRRVQVHGRETEEGEAGLRTALNLPDLHPDDCVRGAVLVTPGSASSGTIARVVVRLLPHAPEIEHAASVQVLAHTAAIEGRIFFAAAEDTPGLAEGERFADVELAAPMALVPGMRLLLRRPSPACNLGVARFLTFGRHRLRKRDAAERDHGLALARALDQPAALALTALEAEGGAPKRPEEVAQALGWTPAAARLELEQLAASGQARAVSKDIFIAAGSTEAIFVEARGVIDHFRARAPERLLIPIQRLRDRLGKEGFTVLEKLPDAQLEILGLRRRRGQEWQILGAEAPAAVQRAAEKLYAVVAGGGMAPGDWKDLVVAAGLAEPEALAARTYLVDSGRIVAPGEDVYLSVPAVEKFRDDVVAQLRGKGMDIPALRDKWNTTRKYVMPVLEHLDACGVTERRGPNRLLRDPLAPVV
jgi:selenocysteine-specific elongation factor